MAAEIFQLLPKWSVEFHGISSLHYSDELIHERTIGVSNYFHILTFKHSCSIFHPLEMMFDCNHIVSSFSCIKFGAGGGVTFSNLFT